MPNIGVLTVELVARVEQFEAAVTRAQKRLESVAETGEKMKKTGQAMMLGITTPITLFAGAALKAAGDMEQMRLAFTTMLGSGEKAAKFLDDLARFAEKTPFEYVDLTMQARRLMAFGFAAEDVIPMLSAIGDTVSAMGGSAEVLERVTRALGQMRAKQKVVGEEMLQLTEAGIPAWEYLARAIGKSTPEVMEMTRKGLIPASTAIQALLKGMEEDFGGLMAEQAKTMLGSFSNLQDVIGRFMRTLGESINKTFNLTQRIQALTEWIGKAADALQNMNPVLRTTVIWFGLAAVLTGPVLFGLGMLVKVSQIAAVGMSLISKIASRVVFAFAAWRTGTATLGETLAFLVGSRFRLITLGIGVIITATILVVKHWNQLVAIAHAVWSAVGAAVLYGASLVARGVGLILTAISVIVPPLRNVAKSVLNFADSLKLAASQSLASAKSAIAMATTSQQAVDNQNALAKTGERAAKGQDKLSKSTEAAAKAAESNIQSFDEVHQIQDAMADTAENVPVVGMPEIGVPSLADIGVGDIAGQIGQQITQITESATKAWERLRQAMEPVNQAVQWIKDNWPTIGPIIEGIAGVITVMLIPALVKSGVEAAATGAKILAAWGMQVAGALAAAGATVVNAAIIVGRWAWMGLQAMWNALKIVAAWALQGFAAVGAVGAMIVNAAIIVGRWAWMGIQALFHAAKMAAAWFIALGPVGWVIATVIALAILIIAKWDWIKERTLAIWSVVSSWLSDKWDWIKGVAVTAWNLIKDSIIASIKTVWDWLVDAWDRISSWLSNKWGWIKDTAKTVWDLVREYIITPIQTAWDWLGNTWDAIANWLSGKWDWIKTTAWSIWDSVRSNIITPIQNAWTWLDTAWGKIAGFLSRTWEGIKDNAKRIWDGVKDTIKGAINGIIGIVNRFIEAFNRIEIRVPSITIPFVGTFGGWSIRVPQIPTIPYLAKGGIIDRPTIVGIGERGPEAVVPLSHDNVLADSIAQAVYQATVDAHRITQASQVDREIVLRIDGATFARLILPALIREGQRQGLQLVVRS